MRASSDRSKPKTKAQDAVWSSAHSPVIARSRAQEVANRAGMTSLVAAAQRGHADVVKLLLNGRTSPLKKLRNGSTSLKKALKKAEEAGHAKVVDILRSAGIDGGEGGS